MLRIFHAGLHAFQKISILYGRNHVLQRIGAGIKYRVGHTGIDLVFKTLALAVSSRLCAEAQCAQRITDTGLQDAVFNFNGITGRCSFIVKRIACDFLGAERAFMHGHKIGADTPADILFSKRTVLDEHIHFNPMTECLMRNQTGNFRGGDNFILARHNRLCVNDFLCRLYGFRKLVTKTGKQFRSSASGHTRIAHLVLSILHDDRRNHSFGIDIALPHVAIFCQEHLADMGRLAADHTVNRNLTAVNRLITDCGQFLNQFLKIGILRHRAGFHLRKYLCRLIRKHIGRINLCAGLCKQIELGIQRFPDFLRKRTYVSGVKSVECILAVQSVFLYTHDIAALCEHGGVRHRLCALGNHCAEADGIRGQNTDIIIMIAQQTDEFLHCRRDRIQIT